jgi:acyl carrier protein
MTRSPASDLSGAIIAIIAETFDADAAKIASETTADDIDGWDSLGHSVLMTRLSRKLGLPIGEDIAGSVENVGQLIQALSDLKARTSHAGA